MAPTFQGMSEECNAVSDVVMDAARRNSAQAPAECQSNSAEQRRLGNCRRVLDAPRDYRVGFDFQVRCVGDYRGKLVNRR
jgi:hypothetical protein